jgi:hypothetical protein
MAKMVIKRFGVFSAAKIYAVVMAGIGLVIGIPLGLLMIIFGAAMMSVSGRGSAAGGGVGIGIGLFYMIGLPIMYGVLGFIIGAIGAAIYNLAAGMLGGVELELENAESSYATPPAPQWNSEQQYQQPPGQQQYPY